MSEWSHGYNVSVGYTYGYFRELGPSWLDYALRLASHQPPQTQGGRRLRYLELGCGQGVNLLLHAAAFPEVDFLGIDFNPLHIAHARELTERTGVKNLCFEEADFLTLARDWPADWGQFDYTVLHGIYSWVSPTLRRAIVDCLAHAVRPGGVVYNSYNSLPGWTTAHPLQHLLRRFETTSGQKPAVAIDNGLALMQRMNDAGATLFKALPQLMTRIEQAQKHDRAYLVQEYLHDAWHPLWHGQVVEEFAAAKLNPAGTATLPEAWLPQLLPEALRNLVNESADPLMRQELIDAAINQSFRRDLFQRGAQKARTVPQARYWQTLRLIALQPVPEDGKYTFSTSFGEVNGQAELYTPLLEALQAGPQSFAQLHTLPAFAGKGMANLIQAITFLLHGGQIALQHSQADLRHVQRVNLALAVAVAEGAPYRYLLSAHSGQALPVSPIDLLLLDALGPAGSKAQGTPEALANALLQRLAALGSNLQKDGQPLTDPEAAKAEARTQAEQFIATRLPSWRRLGLCA